MEPGKPLTMGAFTLSTPPREGQKRLLGTELNQYRVNGRRPMVTSSQASIPGELAFEVSGPENSSQMSDPSGANPISDPHSDPLARGEDELTTEGPRLRLAGTCAGPLTPTIQRLLDFRSELVAARAVILEDAGFIRRRLERSGRTDAISCITGEDAFDGVAAQLDREINRLDLELSRLDDTTVSIETCSVEVGSLQRDS